MEEKQEEVSTSTGLDTIKKIIKLIFSIYPVLLVSAYFMARGYYSVFNIDITPFLTPSDIILLFSPIIWLMGLYIAIFYPLAKMSALKHGPKIQAWAIKGVFKKWDITRAGLILLILIILLIALYLFYEKASIVFNLIIVILSIIVFFVVLDSVWKKITTKDLNELTVEIRTSLLIFGLIILACLPYFIGKEEAKSERDYPKSTNLIVEFIDGERMNLKDSTNLIYVKRTHDFIYLYNKKSKTTRVYRNEEVKCFDTKDTTLL